MQNAYYFEIYATRREPLRFAAAEGSNAVPMMFRVMDWDIPSGATVNIFFEKPSGSLIYNGGRIDGNVIIFDMTTQMTAERGIVEGQIEIIKDDQVLRSFLFYMKVVRSIIDNSAIESTDEFTALQDALARAYEVVPLTDVAGTGSSNLPVYFDNSGKAQPITALDIAHGGTGETTASAALSALGGVPLTSVSNKGNSGLPVYFNPAGVATPITKADLQQTLDIDDIQGDITAINTHLSNLFGGMKVMIGSTNLRFVNSGEMSIEITTGLESVTYALATASGSVPGGNQPIVPNNSTPTIYCRKNYDAAGKITISAYGVGFVTNHNIYVDWIAIGA